MIEKETFQRYKASLILDSAAALGEGPLWDTERACLWWVDILQGEIHQYHPGESRDRHFNFGEMVGAVALDQHGGMLVAAQSGLACIPAKSLENWRIGAKFSPIDIRWLPMSEPLGPEIRFNDGKCDPDGRFWAGTMGLDAAPELGTLYRVDPEGGVTAQRTGLTISNGLAWNPDRHVMYFIDTATQQVTAYAYDPESGDITNGRVVIEVPPSLGAPDGMCIDQQGMLWIALWGGAAVGRWDPDTGELRATIDVPAPQVSSCAFGGHDGKTLYITTARTGLGEAALEQYPHAGGLFTTMLPIPGMPPHRYGAIIERLATSEKQAKK